jgi:hypothetical protein
MFNTIFTKDFYKKCVFGQETDVYFDRFWKKQPLWRHFGECAKVSCCESAGQSSLVKG